MNKAELIASVAEKAGLTKKDAEKAVVAIFDSIQQAMVEGDKVQASGMSLISRRLLHRQAAGPSLRSSPERLSTVLKRLMILFPQVTSAFSGSGLLHAASAMAEAEAIFRQGSRCRRRARTA